MGAQIESEWGGASTQLAPHASSTLRGEAVSSAMNDIPNEGRAAAVPAVSPAVSTPLVWVEAEHIFVARGYIYRVAGHCEHVRDSETVLARSGPDAFTVLSSHAPAELAAEPPYGWASIEPTHGLQVGDRIGDTLVARQHGSNEYTVVHPTAYALEKPPR